MQKKKSDAIAAARAYSKLDTPQKEKKCRARLAELQEEHGEKPHADIADTLHDLGVLLKVQN